ncbi:MAG: bestrophin, partial [Alphaproteobacteria bacterium]|nr:bestrophin [Alphaproteobacteria bacterium]
MVILQTPGGFDLLFRIRGSIVRDILRPLLATTALATLVTVLHESVLPFRYSMTVTPFSLIGLTLAIFLGFRNSVSYDR